jgi:hypothetical protein
LRCEFSARPGKEINVVRVTNHRSDITKPLFLKGSIVRLRKSLQCEDDCQTVIYVSGAKWWGFSAFVYDDKRRFLEK